MLYVKKSETSKHTYVLHNDKGESYVDSNISRRDDLTVSTNFEDQRYSVDVHQSPKLITELLKHRLSDFEDRIRCITLRYPVGAEREVQDFDLEVCFDRDASPSSVLFRVQTYYRSWRRPWSIEEFRDEFKRLTMTPGGSTKSLKRTQLDSIVDRFMTIFLSFDFDAKDDTLEDLANRFVSRVLDFRDQAIANLDAKSRGHALVACFDFPESVHVACEQYLLSFGEFLEDLLGVQSTSDIRHEAGKVLFSVTPKSETEALDRVREALEMYLKFPGEPSVSTLPAIVPAFESQRLILAVQSLELRVNYLNTMAQYKDAIIQQKDATIESLNHQLVLRPPVSFDTVMQLSLKSIEIPKETREGETLLGGYVTVTKYVGKWFEVDFPRLVRFLKKDFAEFNQDPGRALPPPSEGK